MHSHRFLFSLCHPPEALLPLRELEPQSLVSLCDTYSTLYSSSSSLFFAGRSQPLLPFLKRSPFTSTSLKLSFFSLNLLSSSILSFLHSFLRFDQRVLSLASTSSAPFFFTSSDPFYPVSIILTSPLASCSATMESNTFQASLAIRPLIPPKSSPSCALLKNKPPGISPS